MLLICEAYCANEIMGPDFVGISLTPAFLKGLRKRTRLVRELHKRARDRALHSVLFRDTTPVWFLECHQQEDILRRVCDDGPLVVPDKRFVFAQEAEGQPVTAEECFLVAPDAAIREITTRTDTDMLELWPDRLRFSCCIRDTGMRICSESLYFEDIEELAACCKHARPRRQPKTGARR